MPSLAENVSPNGQHSTTLRAKFRGCSSLISSWDGITLLIGISMGKPMQENDKLEAFVELVNEYAEQQKIKKLAVLLTGYLHRHYVQLRWTEYGCFNGASDQVKDMDNKWLDTNAIYLRKLKIPYEVLHWENVAFAPGYKQLEVSIHRDYDQDVEFRTIVDAHNVEYIEKKIQTYVGQDEGVEREKLRQAGRDYILEECMGYVQIKNYGFQHLTYPGFMTPHGQYVLNKYFPDSPLNYACYRIRPSTTVAKLNVDSKGTVKPKKSPPNANLSSETRAKIIRALNGMEWNKMREEELLAGMHRLIQDIKSPIPRW